VKTIAEKYWRKDGLMEKAMKNTLGIKEESSDEESEESVSICYQDGRSSTDTASEDWAVRGPVFLPRPKCSIYLQLL
jgi:hypothetical protein